MSFTRTVIVLASPPSPFVEQRQVGFQAHTSLSSGYFPMRADRQVCSNHHEMHASYNLSTLFVLYKPRAVKSSWYTCGSPSYTLSLLPPRFHAQADPSPPAGSDERAPATTRASDNCCPPAWPASACDPPRPSSLSLDCHQPSTVAPSPAPPASSAYRLPPLTLPPRAVQW
jgi:hypothetical protein